MKPEFSLMVFSNALFIALYLLWNWNEYSSLTTIYQVAINAYFPLTINFSGTTQSGNGLILFQDSNFGLVFFLAAIFVNLYLGRTDFRKTKETKQKPS